jgi:hypothetical protein
MPVVRKYALMLDGVAALSHASVKILPDLCLLRVDLCCGYKTTEPVHHNNDQMVQTHIFP